MSESFSPSPSTKPLLPATSETWLERLAVGSPQREAAVLELREYLVRGLGKALSNVYGNAVSIEDMVHDSLLKILASLDQFQGRSRFTTWAMSIAIRTGVSELRRKYYQHRSLDVSGVEIMIVDEDKEPPEVAANRLREVLEMLEQFIASNLTERQRVAIRGSLEGLPVEVLAEKMGSNRNAIYKLVHDARVRLRVAFEEHGVSAEDLQSLLP